MKRFNLVAVFMAAALFSGLGTSSLSACSSCGCQGKKAIETPACNGEKKAKKCDCTKDKAAVKSPEAMKCGNGKCGSK